MANPADVPVKNAVCSRLQTVFGDQFVQRHGNGRRNAIAGVFKDVDYPIGMHLGEFGNHAHARFGGLMGKGPIHL